MVRRVDREGEVATASTLSRMISAVPMTPGGPARFLASNGWLGDGLNGLIDWVGYLVGGLTYRLGWIPRVDVIGGGSIFFVKQQAGSRF